MHGAYCVGCCWMLMALLFVGGVMNLAWIAALAILVLIEKALPLGQWVGRGVGVALVAWVSPRSWYKDGHPHNSVFFRECAMKPFVALKTALSGPCLARAIAVMIIVGSVLNLINQGEALFQGAHSTSPNSYSLMSCRFSYRPTERGPP